MSGIKEYQDQYQVQAIVQKPVKYLENMWGQELRTDKRNKDKDVEDSFTPKYGQDRMVTGSLPFATSPRLYNNKNDRMIAVDTRISRACFNDCIAQAGPFYLRHWQIWDTAPFKPSTGDVTKDPRYGENTRQFTMPFRKNGL